MKNMWKKQNVHNLCRIYVYFYEKEPVEGSRKRVVVIYEKMGVNSL
jgi:hypothetical protein